MISEMLEAMTRALASQHVAPEKVRHIVSRMEGMKHSHLSDSIWRTFCESCLEVGLDPQAVFAIAAMNYSDSGDSPKGGEA